MRTHRQEVEGAVEDARLWRELIDELLERGESLDEAMGVADRLLHARRLRGEEQTTSEPPPPPSLATPGGEEPLG